MTQYCCRCRRWGAFTLFAAQRYPNSRITAVSNSRTQREYIEGECRRLGLANVTVVTRDVNELQLPAASFDRVVSVEMLEHVKNYEVMLRRISSWMRDDALLFIHIFCHKDTPYDFEDGWMAEHFFTGGTMPSAQLFLFFQDHLALEDQVRSAGWLVSCGRGSAD